MLTGLRKGLQEPSCWEMGTGQRGTWAAQKLLPLAMLPTAFADWCLPCPHIACWGCAVICSGLVASQSHSHPDPGGARRDLPTRGALRVFFLSCGHPEVSRRLSLGVSPFSLPRPSGPFLQDFPDSSLLCALPGAPEVGGVALAEPGTLPFRPLPLFSASCLPAGREVSWLYFPVLLLVLCPHDSSFQELSRFEHSFSQCPCLGNGYSSSLLFFWSSVSVCC